MFDHAWKAYRDNAFPDDELRPLSCEGLERDTQDATNTGLNDVLGSYSLTLIDTLDMFAVLGDSDGFAREIERVKRYVTFDVDSTVQVFETTIRAMGGLLSAHLLASTPRLGVAVPAYDGFLLGMAHDLGERLLPAFDTGSGIPAPRVNLKFGMRPDKIKVTAEGEPDVTETCTSGAGSLLLEFGLLSRLTGDQRFERASRQAFFALYARRTNLDLVPMSVDSRTGAWLAPLTGTGASIDSYYEYAAKYAILFNDDLLMRLFGNMYQALKAHSFEGWAFRVVNSMTAGYMTKWIDALGAFFPTLMVLAGDLGDAVKVHLTYWKVWQTFGAMPERFNLVARDEHASSNATVALEWYPLRPEFVESTYYLYLATRDPFYLHVGQTVMRDLDAYNKVECGYAGTQDVRTGSLTDRMESFFLSETVKYLYLLFDVDNPLNKETGNFVWSTEAHMFWYDGDVVEHAGHANFESLSYMKKYKEEAAEQQQDIEGLICEPDDAEHSTAVESTTGTSSTPDGLLQLPSKVLRFFDRLLLPDHMAQVLQTTKPEATETAINGDRIQNQPNSHHRRRSSTAVRNKGSTGDSSGAERRYQGGTSNPELFVREQEAEQLKHEQTVGAMHLRHEQDVNSTGMTGKAAAAAAKAGKFWYMSQCPVPSLPWHQPHLGQDQNQLSTGFLYSSAVASWDCIDDVNRLYTFSRPARFSVVTDDSHSEEADNDSTHHEGISGIAAFAPLADHNPDAVFQRRYVGPSATCRAAPPAEPARTVADMVISRPPKTARGRVLFQDTRRGVLVSSLYGVRIKLSAVAPAMMAAAEQDAVDYYRVDTVDGVTVGPDSTVYVMQLSSIPGQGAGQQQQQGTGRSGGAGDSREEPPKVVEVMGDGRIQVHGHRVTNLRAVV